MRLAVVAVLTLACPGAAGAATPAQVASLARRAATQPGALAQLRAIHRVDGRQVDLRDALDTSGGELTARLRTLSEPAVGHTVTGDARNSARSILAEQRFTGSSVPRPLHRPLAWLGRELHRLYNAVARPLPGGGRTFWTIVAAAVVALSAFFAFRLANRRAGRRLEGGVRGTRVGEAEDPRRLEREADEAERAGDLERALRLRFRAGVIRLMHARVIPEPAGTNGAIARELGSASFGRLATDFDEVVYGRRDAQSEDVTRARGDWPRVVEEATRR